MRFREIIFAAVTYRRCQHTLWVKFREFEYTETGQKTTDLKFTARGHFVVRQSNLRRLKTTTTATEMLIINSD